MPDVMRIVPVAPSTGDSRFTADMAVYGATRALQGSPRWAMAQSDDELGVSGLFKAFRCALGVSLTRAGAAIWPRDANGAPGRFARGTAGCRYGRERRLSGEEA